MRHVISILMANESGALVRVAGMFSQRGFNIETLNVAPTEDVSMSRLTLVTTGTENVVEQINRQLLKLVDVIDVLDMTGGKHVERELALIKVRCDADSPSLEALVEPYDVTEICRENDLRTLRFLGGGDALNTFIARLAEAGVLVESARSGALSMTPGPEGLRYHYDEADTRAASF